ncbi:MAG: DUF2764 family protein [Rikenellaceae bacterium]
MINIESLKKLKANKQYYCLVAGLPELGQKATAVELNFAELRAEIQEEVSRGDRETLALLYTFYDILNIVNKIHGTDLPHNSLGNLSSEQLVLEIEDQADDSFVSGLPVELARVLENYKEGEAQEIEDDRQAVTLETLESELWQCYYRLAARSSCRFIRLWSATDRSMRNVIAAEKARLLGVDPVQVMVGGGDVVEQIASSTAADFGLRGEFEYIEELLDVTSTVDFVEREHKMDQLRWSIAEELSEQNYFDINFLGAYLVRLNILERWSSLSKSSGESRFRQIVESFTSQVEL